LAAGNKDEVDDFYELISLADRLSSVSKQLQEEANKMGMKSLKLAAEDTECLSTRLRAKAEALKSLSVNAKSWEGDIKRANKNLKNRIDGSTSLQPQSTPKIDISPPQIVMTSRDAMSPIPSECGSEVEKIKRKLQTFKFDDNGVPGLLRQQLEDYKELRKQLKSAVQSAELSKEISEVSNKPSKRRVRYGSSKPSYTLISPKSSKSQMENTVKSTSGNSLQQVDSNKMEPLLIITPHHDISDNNSSTSITPKIDHYNRKMKNQVHSPLTPLSGVSGATVQIRSPPVVDHSTSEPIKPKSETRKISEEESNAARIAKVRDLRDVISHLEFDQPLYNLANNCNQALDECEQVLQAFQSETPRLIDQIELNDQLNQRMEDIYPDIEKTDDISSTAVKKATTQKSRVAAIRVSSLLFDRWETIRVRLATRQNIIEIQILEDEQYKRMVEGYKSEQTSPVVSFT